MNDEWTEAQTPADLQGVSFRFQELQLDIAGKPVQKDSLFMLRRNDIRSHYRLECEGLCLFSMIRKNQGFVITNSQEHSKKECPVQGMLTSNWLGNQFKLFSGLKLERLLLHCKVVSPLFDTKMLVMRSTLDYDRYVLDLFEEKTAFKEMQVAPGFSPSEEDYRKARSVCREASSKNGYVTAEGRVVMVLGKQERGRYAVLASSELSSLEAAAVSLIICETL